MAKVKIVVRTPNGFVNAMVENVRYQFRSGIEIEEELVKKAIALLNRDVKTKGQLAIVAVPTEAELKAAADAKAIEDKAKADADKASKDAADKAAADAKKGSPGAKAQ